MRCRNLKGKSHARWHNARRSELGGRLRHQVQHPSCASDASAAGSQKVFPTLRSSPPQPLTVFAHLVTLPVIPTSVDGSYEVGWV